MNPVKFKECNVVFGENQPEYKPLPALYSKDVKGTVITCWELTDDDLQKIIETRKIYLSQLTFNNGLQPVFLTVNKNDLIINKLENENK